MSGDICDVCGKPSIGVASSSLGAVSFAFCRECVVQRAEPEGMFVFTASCVGSEVAPHVRELQTYVDGNYVTWDQWIASEAGQQAMTLGYEHD